jgi:hypothetical protein
LDKSAVRVVIDRTGVGSSPASRLPLASGTYEGTARHKLSVGRKQIPVVRCGACGAAMADIDPMMPPAFLKELGRENKIPGGSP